MTTIKRWWRSLWCRHHWHYKAGLQSEGCLEDPGITRTFYYYYCCRCSDAAI